MNENKVISVKEENLDFNVRIIEKNDCYGLDFQLIHKVDSPLVEFYDKRYNHTIFGQFVSRYYMETLLETNGGLLLDTASPDWKISSSNMDIIRKWMAEYKESNLKDKIEYAILLSNNTHPKDLISFLEKEKIDFEFQYRNQLVVIKSFDVSIDSALNTFKNNNKNCFDTFMLLSEKFNDNKPKLKF